MKGNKLIYIGIATLVLGIGFAIGTYAYYSTTITGTATGTILAWECTANNAGESENFSISLGTLYPGSTGSKAIVVEATIDADYTITFSNLTNIGNGAHPNLKLYKANTFTAANVISEGTSLTGLVTGGDSSTTTFWYNWPYEGTDTYASSAPTATITVVCDQK